MEKKGLSLYALSEEERRIEQAIADGEGELTPELEEAMDAVRSAVISKVDAYRHILSRLDGTIATAKAERERITRLIRTCENGKKHLKENLLDYMAERGISRIDSDLFTAKVKLNPPRVEYDEDTFLKAYEKAAEDFRATLPSYVKVELSVNKNELRKAIEEGAPVAASLVREQTVTIR